MANRVTGTEVKTIITTVKTDSEVENYIPSANVLVTEVLSGSGFSDDRKALIEKWLAAHFVAIDDASTRIMEEKAGDATNKYEGRTGMRLNYTRWGQQVLILDTSGSFADLGKGPAEVKTIA